MLFVAFSMCEFCDSSHDLDARLVKTRENCVHDLCLPLVASSVHAAAAAVAAAGSCLGTLPATAWC